MIIARTLVPSATPTSLFDLIGNQARHNVTLYLQAPAGNITFGDKTEQPMAVPTTILEIQSVNTKDLYVVGNAAASLLVFISF